MASKTAASHKTPCPMFPSKEGDDRQTFAEDIKFVEVTKMTRDAYGKEVRTILPTQKQCLVIDPTRTTDQDFVDAYCKKPGTYYVSPIGHDPSKGRHLPGGHYIRVPTQAEINGEDAEDDEEETGDEESEEKSSKDKIIESLVQGQQQSFQQQLQEASDNKRRELEMHSRFAETMVQTVVEQHRTAAPPADVIAELREQITDIRRRAVRDEEDMRRNHREELARLQQTVEDLRRSHREEISRRDDAISDMRRRNTTEEDDMRRRWRDDTTEVRTKYEREISEQRTNAENRISKLSSELLEVRTKLTSESDALRTRLETRVHELQTENIRLEKDLALTKAELENTKQKLEEAMSEPAAPSESGSPLMNMLQSPQLQEAVGSFAKRILEPQPAPAPASIYPPQYAQPIPPAWQEPIPPPGVEPEPESDQGPLENTSAEESAELDPRDAEEEAE